MTGVLQLPAWLAVLALIAAVALLALVVALLGSVRRQRRHTEVLRAQLAGIEERLAAAPRPPDVVPVRDEEPEYVITALGEHSEREPAPTVPAPVFADIVMRESVIRTASLAAGLRRALSPEVRNRIRFEMRREVKRSRKQRRSDLKQARREWEARQRAQMDPA